MRSEIVSFPSIGPTSDQPTLFISSRLLDSELNRVVCLRLEIGVPLLVDILQSLARATSTSSFRDKASNSGLVTISKMVG